MAIPENFSRELLRILKVIPILISPIAMNVQSLLVEVSLLPAKHTEILLYSVVVPANSDDPLIFTLYNEMALS